jgi:hypothetical protein
MQDSASLLVPLHHETTWPQHPERPEHYRHVVSPLIGYVYRQELGS